MGLFVKGYENCLDDYACPSVPNLISEMKNMNGGVATSDFVMQKVFTVQKEKHLHTEHGLDVFLSKLQIPIILRYYL